MASSTAVQAPVALPVREEEPSSKSKPPRAVPALDSAADPLPFRGAEEASTSGRQEQLLSVAPM